MCGIRRSCKSLHQYCQMAGFLSTKPNFFHQRMSSLEVWISQLRKLQGKELRSLLLNESHMHKRTLTKSWVLTCFSLILWSGAIKSERSGSSLMWSYLLWVLLGKKLMKQSHSICDRILGARGEDWPGHRNQPGLPKPMWDNSHKS